MKINMQFLHSISNIFKWKSVSLEAKKWKTKANNLTQIPSINSKEANW